MTPKTRKSSLIYHMFKPNLTHMTPEQKFRHMVTVRDRTLGEEGVKPSAYLDLEISEDNKRFLRVTPENVNMFRVLQESTCRHGSRRQVAARTLNALGHRSGLSCSREDQ